MKVRGKVKVKGSATERSKPQIAPRQIDCLKGSPQGEFTNQITQSSAVGGMRKSNCKLARRASELGASLSNVRRLGGVRKAKVKVKGSGTDRSDRVCLG